MNNAISISFEVSTSALPTITFQIPGDDESPHIDNLNLVTFL